MEPQAIPRRLLASVELFAQCLGLFVYKTKTVNLLVPRDAGIDFATIPAEGDFKLLRYVDPYGDTLFNGIQMDDFLTDWDNLRPASTQVEEWKHVRELAMRCKSEPHLYIRFIGD